jgi:hypothetical protein
VQPIGGGLGRSAAKGPALAHDFGPMRISDDEGRFEGHQAGPRGLSKIPPNFGLIRAVRMS